MSKTPFVTRDQLEQICKDYPTPFHIYDEAGIRETARNAIQGIQLESGLPGVFCREGHPHPPHPEDSEGGGLRRGLLLADGAHDERPLRLWR